jgi:hypothetical protein
MNMPTVPAERRRVCAFPEQAQNVSLHLPENITNTHLQDMVSFR